MNIFYLLQRHTRKMLPILSCLLFIGFFTTNTFANRTQDSLSLIALYNATGGPDWSNTWDLTQPMSNWYGVQLNNQGRVNGLDLDGEPFSNCSICGGGRGNNMTGTLPCLLYTSPSPRDLSTSRMPSSA